MQYSGQHTSGQTAMTTVTLSINGMHCAGCVLSAEQALRMLPAVKSVHVSLEPAEAEVEWDNRLASKQDLQDAIAGAGFSVTPLIDD